MFTLVAYGQSQDTSGVLTEVNALVDQHITTQGKEILVPEWASMLSFILALGATISRAQMSSPSLRKKLLLDVPNLEKAATPSIDPTFLDLTGDPKPLVPGEGLRALVAEAAGGAELEFILAGLSGEFKDKPAGEVIWLRLTGTTTAIANTWTPVPLTLGQSLEAGRYAVVGMKAFGATLIAARLILPGSGFRPGCIGFTSEAQKDLWPFIPGPMGNWGEFDHRFPPQGEILCTAGDTAQTIYLALIKVA
jgi:hypothetical protein